MGLPITILFRCGMTSSECNEVVWDSWKAADLPKRADSRRTGPGLGDSQLPPRVPDSIGDSRFPREKKAVPPQSVSPADPWALIGVH